MAEDPPVTGFITASSTAAAASSGGSSPGKPAAAAEAEPAAAVAAQGPLVVTHEAGPPCPVLAEATATTSSAQSSPNA